ncbi:hypothetical protein FHR71_000155 [Methylobacterium sp. RAS18]|nr:hypothetical protein [Methylobacterium sp. RAS18]MCP1560068.1 hypothetical protein [Methylorubrum extorquens]MDF9865422.1 hypothetical protein [Methylorubrum pseudosasae]MDH6638992.1 hypothetical protein [Methylobacterium sp. SuP10 SLI 274]MDH6668180.1 hypothetical protein [Methylorubrum zatmanii]
MMGLSGRGIFLGAALLTGLAGSAAAAEDKRAASPSPAKDRNEAATGSVGAGGLTGSGATKDGARTGASDTPRPAGSSAPAAGTAR